MVSCGADIKLNRGIARKPCPGFVIDGSFASVHDFPEQVLHVHLPVDEVVEAVDADAFLLHGVAVADGHAVVGERVVVHGDAEGRAYGILAAVALADGVFLVVHAAEVELERVHDFACLFGQAVLFHQG